MSADDFLSRLRKVKRTSAGNWIACCPAHEDKNPSMTIRELEDGTVLLHCFGGCSVESIIGAVGMDFDALFPPKEVTFRKPLRRPFNAHDVLECVAVEALYVSATAAQIASGLEIKPEDRERLMLAQERLEAARSLANG